MSTRHWECETHSSFWTRSRDTAADHELTNPNCEVFSLDDDTEDKD